MRTTLDVDDDVIQMARKLASGRRISVGKALSELARRGAKTRVSTRNGFHVFVVDEGVPQFGTKDIEAALEAEDEEYGENFPSAKD